MNRFVSASAAVVALAALAGCSGSASNAALPSGSPPSSTSSTSGTEASTAAPGSSPVQEAFAGMDAEEVVLWLGQQGVPIVVTRVYDETTDPNNRLGRPGGYTSKAAFQDARVPKSKFGSEPDDANRGGSVEVFVDGPAAVARAAEVQGKLKDFGLGSEYDYVVGGVLIRVSGTVTPSQAAAYEAALGVAPQPAA